MGKKGVKGVLWRRSRPSVIKNSSKQASFSFLDFAKSLLSRSQPTKARQGTNPFSGEADDVQG